MLISPPPKERRGYFFLLGHHLRQGECMWYLKNHLADFNQTYMDITVMHDEELNRFW